jgi:hypothetical protein
MRMTGGKNATVPRFLSPLGVARWPIRFDWKGKMVRRLRFFASRSVALGGLSIFAVAYAGLSQSYGRCRNDQDRLAATQGDPRYPALQRVLDSYFAERQKAKGFSGISLHVSPSARK